MANIILKNRYGEPVVHENRTSIKLNTQEGGQVLFYEQGSQKDHTFDIPYIDGTYTYTGSSQTPTKVGFYSDFMTMTGNTSATNAGNYSITVSLKDTENCQWRDGTTEAKTINWSIAKAALPTPILSSNKVEFTPEHTSESITITRNGDGMITVISSDSSIVEATVSGTTVTLIALDTTNEANVDINIYVAESSNYLAYTDDDCLINVDVFSVAYSSFVIHVLADNTNLSIAWSQSEKNGVFIDWGDGSTPQTAEGGYCSEETIKYSANLSHTYAMTGTYNIKFTCIPGVYYSLGRKTGMLDYRNIFNYVCNSSSSRQFEPTNVKAYSFEGASGVASSGRYAFYRTSIEYFSQRGTTCNTISINTFDTCVYLKNIDLPSSIETIANSAIAYCTILSTLRIAAINPPVIYSQTFSGTKQDMLIYVHRESVEAYKSAEFWSLRALYIRAIPE